MGISRPEIINSLKTPPSHWHRIAPSYQDKLIDDALKNHSEITDILTYINLQVISIVRYGHTDTEARQVCGGC